MADLATSSAPCGRCTALSPAGSRFCIGCGNPLAPTCAHCGQANPPHAAFCGGCGTSLSRPAASRDGEAEFKPVTVLFADIVSSTELVADLDAEAAMQRLRPLLDTMSRTVERFGGTTISTLGDGIMALFGVPYTQEGHALRACEAALAIRDAIKAEQGDLSVRAGLHSGEVVAEAMAQGQAGNYAAFGVALHIGSRLPAQVAADGICMTEACYRLVRDACDTDPLGRQPLRGVPQPVALYALRGLKPPEARPAFQAGGLSPFLARGSELATLDRALQDADASAGAVVSVIGAAGAGKSRLCHEFAEQCRRAGIKLFETRAQPYGVTIPFKPVTDLLRSAYFAIEPDATPEHAALAVAAHLSELGGTTAADVGLICEMLAIPSQAAPQSFMSSGARTARLRHLIERLVQHGGAELKVLLLEDLHWLDEPSEAFIEAIAGAIPGTRTMLLVNCRTDHPSRVLALPACQTLVLNDLTPGETSLLVDHLVGPNAGLAEIRERITERCGGNPFFAEELVRSLADDGVLIGQPGAYLRSDLPDTGQLPSTVQAVIGARIDHLPKFERDLLHVAAVIGREFDLGVLNDVTGDDAATLSPAFERLCSTSLLMRMGRLPPPAFAFRHPLIREVAYATQLKARRNVLHRAVARAMERAAAGAGDETAGLIAYHLEEAGENNEAAFYAARAARWIGQTNAGAAIKQWHKVRSLIASQPRTPANDILRIEANGQIGWLGWRDGMTPEEASPYLQEALAWARETDDSMIPLLMLIGNRIEQVSGGDADAFVARTRSAIALAERKHDRGRVATIEAQLSHAYGWAGLLREALAANDAALAGADYVTRLDQQLLGYSVKHWATALRGRILLRLGQFDAARHCLDATIALRGAIDPTVSFIAHFGYVDLAWSLRDPDMAAAHAAQIAELADHHGSAYLRLYQLASEAIAHAIAGRFDRAIDSLRGSLDFQRRTGAAIEYEPELLASLAELLHQTGAHVEAAATVSRTIELTRQRHARLPQCRALITRAKLDPDRTEADRAEARALIEETGAVIYVPLLDQLDLAPFDAVTSD